MTDEMSAPTTWSESGPVQLRSRGDGTIDVLGPVPRVVEMSRELFMDWLFELNEHRRERGIASAGSALGRVNAAPLGIRVTQEEERK